jgi:hypothetical protein
MPKRHIDQFDIEAEREGAAVRLSGQQVCKPFGYGRGITKQRRAHKDGAAKVECRTVKQSFRKFSYA